jgi:hypothetical protein
VRQACDKAQNGEGCEGRRQRAGDVAECKHRHQQKEERPTGQLGGKCRNHRRADNHAECVGADDVPRLRRRHVERAGDVRQQAHDDEFAGADAEAADGERQRDQGDRCFRRFLCDFRRGETVNGDITHGRTPVRRT